MIFAPLFMQLFLLSEHLAILGASKACILTLVSSCAYTPNHPTMDPSAPPSSLTDEDDAFTHRASPDSPSTDSVPTASTLMVQPSSQPLTRSEGEACAFVQAMPLPCQTRPTNTCSGDDVFANTSLGPAPSSADEYSLTHNKARHCSLSRKERPD